jgi:hypothetical protein
MAFERKDYGMNSGIPFTSIADRVEVNVALEGERISDPPMVRKEGLTGVASCSLRAAGASMGADRTTDGASLRSAVFQVVTLV